MAEIIDIVVINSDESDGREICNHIESMPSKYHLEMEFRTDFYSDSRIALDYLKNNKPKILFIDNSLPNFVGTRILDEIGSDPLYVNLKHSWVIGAGFEKFGEKLDDFLEKPFFRDELEKVIIGYAGLVKYE